jgi:hypothetical protein
MVREAKGRFRIEQDKEEKKEEATIFYTASFHPHYEQNPISPGKRLRTHQPGQERIPPIRRFFMIPR